ncbi:MAG: hypothetical protein ACYTAN_15735 [Planctomycetota bacterium]|jgi:hypothetical protein
MRKLDGVLVSVAIISVVIYALACRPAWHPSGKSVAVPFVTEDGSGILVYDLAKKQTEILLCDTDQDAYASANCLWTGDGKSLVVTVASSEMDSVKVQTLDPATKAVTDVAVIEGLHESGLWLPSILVADQYLWLANSLEKADDEGYFVARVDLSDGKVEEFFESKNEAFFLAQRADGVICAVKSIEGGEEGPPTVEVGLLDAQTGEMTGLFKVEDSPEHVLWQYLASDAEGKRFAVVLGGEEPGSLTIMGRDGKTFKEFPLEGLADGAYYLTWVGDRVWLAAARDDEESGEKQVGLLAIDTASGESRFVKLADNPRTDDDVMLRMQPSVSPDGRMLAVAGLYLEPPEGTSAIALVIFDLTKPGAPPEYIPVGPLPEDLKKDAEEAEPDGEGETSPAAGDRAVESSAEVDSEGADDRTP